MSSVEFVVVEEPEPRGLPAFVAETVGTFLLVFFICGFISVASAGRVIDLAGLGARARLHPRRADLLARRNLGRALQPSRHVRAVVAQEDLHAQRGRLRDLPVVGGILGALVVLLLFNDVGDAVNYGATAINGEVLQDGSVWLGLLAEALGTFLLMWAIMGLAVNPRGEAALAGLGIGAALGVAVMVFGPATGAGLNPARWLGPAVVSGEFDDFWLYIVGPLVGAVAAALAYRAFVLDPRWLPAQRPKDELPG